MLKSPLLTEEYDLTSKPSIQLFYSTYLQILCEKSFFSSVFTELIKLEEPFPILQLAPDHYSQYKSELFQNLFNQDTLRDHKKIKKIAQKANDIFTQFVDQQIKRKIDPFFPILLSPSASYTDRLREQRTLLGLIIVALRQDKDLTMKTFIPIVARYHSWEKNPAETPFPLPLHSFSPSEDSSTSSQMLALQSAGHITACLIDAHFFESAFSHEGLISDMGIIYIKKLDILHQTKRHILEHTIPHLLKRPHTPHLSGYLSLSPESVSSFDKAQTLLEHILSGNIAEKTKRSKNPLHKAKKDLTHKVAHVASAAASIPAMQGFTARLATSATQSVQRYLERRPALPYYSQQERLEMERDEKNLSILYTRKKSGHSPFI